MYDYGYVFKMWSYSYMHYVGLHDYMMKVVDTNEVVFTYLLMYELDVVACDLMIDLLNTWEVIGLHMYLLH